MPERKEERKGAVPEGSVREDSVNESAATHPAESRSGKTKEDIASRDSHAPGVSASPLGEKGANVRQRGMPAPEATSAPHLGNKAYQGETGRGEELTRENATRTDRRDSHGRVSPADTENVTEPSGKQTNQ